uniref:Uncharacterized protein n=1 Tax=Strigamia maritima TaxID=126957 RepID=T1J4Q0_STRMM
MAAAGDSRPGRPPKRASLLGMSPSQETLLKLKKARLENGDYSSYENGHIAVGFNELQSVVECVVV